MVIGGFTDPQGARTGFGALLLGVYDDGELRYSGKVGTGFDERALDDAAPAARQARAEQAAVRESAARVRSQGRALGQARPRRGNRVHRMEQRRRAAPSVVPGLARRQEGGRRRARRAAARRRRAAHAAKPPKTRRAKTAESSTRDRRPPAAKPRGAIRERHRRRRRHLTPGQALLSRSRHHQGRGRAIPRADGAVDPAAHRRSAAVAGPLSRRLEPAVLLSEARRQERQRRGRSHQGAGRRRNGDVHGRGEAPRRSSRSSSGACSNCIPGARARRASTVPTG